MTVLTGKRDAYGRAMWDRLHDGSVTDLVERSDGLLGVDYTGSYFADYRKWPQRQKQALRLARGRVLDVGCGAGRVALHLQSKGFDVLGVDNSELAAKVCRKRGVKKVKAVPISAVNGDFGMFDTIVMYGNNFGLFANARQAVRLLRRFARLTSPDARILAESLNPYKTKDRLHLNYQRENRRRGRMSGQIRMRIRYRDLATPWHDYLFVSPDEMRALAEAAGWRLTRAIGSDGVNYVGVLEKQRT